MKRRAEALKNSWLEAVACLEGQGARAIGMGFARPEAWAAD